MTLNIHELRAAAEKATPGPWSNADRHPDPDCSVRYVHPAGEEGRHNEVCSFYGAFEENARNSGFIAACSPERIIALCDALAEMRNEFAGFVIQPHDAPLGERHRIVDAILARHGLTLDAPEGR